MRIMRSTQQALYRQGIQTGIHHPAAVHLPQAYTDLAYQPRDLPCSEHGANEVLSLPMFAEISDEQINVVAQGIRKFAA